MNLSSNEIIDEIFFYSSSIVEDFRAFLSNEKTPLSPQEHSLELLALGNLLTIHHLVLPKFSDFSLLFKFLEREKSQQRHLFHLPQWYEFLSAMKPEDSERVLRQAIRISRRVERLAEKSFSQSRINLPQRDKKSAQSMSIVASSIMNSLARPDFIRTRKKAVIVPTALKSPSGFKCHARKLTSTSRCRACSTDCPVWELTKIGGQLGFDVLVSKVHMSESDWKHEEMFRQNVGVLIVAPSADLFAECWKARRASIPFQALAADQCCSFNLEELLSVLGFVWTTPERWLPQPFSKLRSPCPSKNNPWDPNPFSSTIP